MLFAIGLNCQNDIKEGINQMGGGGIMPPPPRHHKDGATLDNQLQQGAFISKEFGA